MGRDLRRAAVALAISSPILLGIVSCSKKTEVQTTVQTGDTTAPPPAMPPEGDTTHAAQNLRPVKPATEADHIVVQHILIGFKNDDGSSSVPGKTITRTHAEAEALSQEILNRAWNGENFDGLVRQYTDDQHPGIYKLANRGVTPSGGDEFPREQMVAGFGDVAFSLSPGNVSVAVHDPAGSPFGWHIIKRIQ